MAGATAQEAAILARRRQVEAAARREGTLRAGRPNPRADPLGSGVKLPSFGMPASRHVLAQAGVDPAARAAAAKPAAEAKPAADAQPANTDGVPALGSSKTTAASLTTRYANNPRAVAALDTLTSDPSFSKLSAAQQGGLLDRFAQAPNAATAQYVGGIAAYHGSEDKQAGLAAYQNALKPDGGSFKANGTSYTIKNGDLLDAKGNKAGTIGTDGNYQLTGGEAQNYYDDIHARVNLTEGAGKDSKTLLDLHDADKSGRMDSKNIAPQMREKGTAIHQALRKEGVSMAVVSGYRSVAEQNRLYAKGRTAPGNKVTGVRGGGSWHNYGMAIDSAFHTNSKGKIGWPEKGEYKKLWTRYGELAEAEGMTWGGRWKSPVDRPHIQLTGGSAYKQRATYNKGGLSAVWRKLGADGNSAAPATSKRPVARPVPIPQRRPVARPVPIPQPRPE